MDTKHQIHHLLNTVEAKHDVSVLYACESGSRAWGVASPNSDFDIRFLYRSPQDIYLSVFEHKDTIEIPIKDDLDPGGWDIKKALGLLAKSNGALIEWLHSPIVYSVQESFREHWQKLSLEILNPSHLINHYKGLAFQIQKRKLSTEHPSAKGYLYACRALLAAQWVKDQRTPPPVPFIDLLEIAQPSLKAILQETVEWKATSDEVASRGRIPELETFINTQLSSPTESLSHLAPETAFIQATLDEEFKRLIK